MHQTGHAAAIGLKAGALDGALQIEYATYIRQNDLYRRIKGRPLRIHRVPEKKRTAAVFCAYSRNFSLQHPEETSELWA